MTEKVTNDTGVLVSKTHLISILEASPIGVSISQDHDGKIIYVNSSLANLWGGPAEELLGTNSIGYYHDPDDIAWAVGELRKGRSVMNHEMEMDRADGTTIWCQVNMVATRVDNSRVILTWFNDISDMREIRSRLKYMAWHDSLTGLSNRMHFNEFMEGAIARSGRLGVPGCLLFLDLDGFKAVNDLHGHHFGDFLLMELAKRLKETLRKTDFTSRLGGDEFAVVLEGLSDRPHPEIVAQKLLRVINEPYTNGNVRVFVSASIGITFFGTEPEDVDTITRRADLAMYQAKHSGKAQFRYYDEDTDV